MDVDPSLTQLLQLFAATRDRTVADAIVRNAWPRLRQIAASTLRNEKAGACTPTELFNETWATRLYNGRWQVHDREEFFALTAKAMRFVLVDLARKRRAQKRLDDHGLVSLDSGLDKAGEGTATAEQILAIDNLIEHLEKTHPEAARVFELKYFLGFTLEEIAEIQHLSFRQVRHRWDKASDWLKKRLGY